MKIAPILAALAASVFGLVGCASSNGAPLDDGPKGIEDEAGVGLEDTALEKNPDGVDYPTDNIGHSARKPTKPGNRIKNYKFRGYPDADVAGGLQAISLAQYFDPTGSRYKIVHIQAAGVWCGYCKAETEIVVPMKAELEAKGVVWLVSLAEGPTPGTASTQKDLDGWISTFKSPFTHWLDPGNANLGPFYDRSALPWNASIDATTMEILKSGTGAATTKEAILREIDDALALAATSTLRKKAE